MCCFLYIFYNKILVFNIFIVDTIGSVDNLIEKYEEIIHKNNKIFNYLYDKNKGSHITKYC